MTTKTNGHGYFRKSKAYGLVCGIALATAFLGAHVSADEVTVTQDMATPQSVLTTQDSTVAQSDVSPSVTTSVEVETPSTDTTSLATGDSVETPKEDTTASDVTDSTDEVVETPKQETNLQLPEATTPEQEKINQTVEDTKDILDDAGVKVEVNGENHYTDPNEAQTDADNQKVEAEKFAETQKAIDEAIKQAQALAQEAGLTVTLKPTTVTSIDEAKAKLAEVQKLIEEATNKLIADKKAETEANKLIEEAKKKAEVAGVIITTTEKQNYDKADDALADAENQKDQLEAFAQMQQSIDEAIKQAQALAQKAGLTVNVSTIKVTSIEEAKAKLAEVQKLIETATNKLIADKKAETEANKLIEEAKKKAEEAGVIITTTEKQNYDKAEDATADAESQKDKLEAFAQMQQSIDEAIKQAQALAQKAGLTVNVSPIKVTSIDEAKAKLAEVQKLIEEATNKLIADKKAETEANKLIEEAKKKAESAGVIITTTEKQHYDKADDAIADAEAQKQKLEEIINAQNSVNKQLQDLMASLNAVTQTITGNKVTVSSIEEANKKLAEIKAKIQAVDKLNAQLKAEYDAEVQRVNEHNAQLKADYEKKLAQYEADKAEYDKKLAEYEANKGKDGYLNQTYVQGLIFKSEADAHVTIVKSDGSIIVNDSTDSHRVVLHQGESVTVTYTNLKNSYYNGVKIDKVVYVYTAKDAVNGLHISNNPNITVTFISSDFDTDDKNGEQNGSQSSHIGMSIQFFDEKGQVITFNEKNPALIAFNSLNKTEVYAGSGYGESIQNLSSNIKIETIGGSSVIYKDGVLYAGNYNDYVSNGSRFDANPATDPNNYWDGDTQANRWYGAAVGVVSSGDTISFDVVMDAGADAKRHEYGKFWFAFSSDVAAPVLTPPTPPEVPNYKKDPTTPPDYQKVNVPTIQIKTDVHEVGINKTTSMDVQTPQLETTVHEVGVNKTTEMEVETPQLETDVHEVGINKTTEMEVETPQLKMNVHTVAYDKPATPEAPQIVKSSVLPMTGDTSGSIVATIAGFLMTLVGLVGIRKRKEN
ncbi:LPXTG cell wall anchor domain-containing protein [Streptococcus pasteurianus]|nr:LPXTG cell wall anchor domain-containing protein [Streptococcus pasteurianus]